MFWSVSLLCKKPCRVALNAPIRTGTETNYRFVPETKRTHPIHFFGPNSDVLVRFGQFRYCAKNHANVAFNAPIRARTETNFRFAPETKRTHPIHFFGPNSDVLVRFGQFRYCAKNHANVAFKAPIRARNETNFRFTPETKRTHPINFFGPNSDVLVRFGRFRYCAKDHANVAFNAPIRAGTETNYRFRPETKRTHPIHFFGPNIDVLVHFGQFHSCAENHVGVHLLHRFGPEIKRCTDSSRNKTNAPSPLFWTQ